MSAPIIDVDENLRLLGTAHVATASVEAVALSSMVLTNASIVSARPP